MQTDLGAPASFPLFTLAGRAPKEPNLGWHAPVFVGDLATPGMTPGALRVLMALKTFADVETGVCFPSHATIAARLGVRDTRTVRRHIEKLVELGCIEKEAAPRRQSNTYRIVERFASAGRALAQAARAAVRACRPSARGGFAPQGGGRPPRLSQPTAQIHEQAAIAWVKSPEGFLSGVMSKLGATPRRGLSPQFA